MRSSSRLRLILSLGPQAILSIMRIQIVLASSAKKEITASEKTVVIVAEASITKLMIVARRKLSIYNFQAFLPSIQTQDSHRKTECLKIRRGQGLET